MQGCNYVVFRRNGYDGFHVHFSTSDPYDVEVVKSHVDNALHRALGKIFRERCLPGGHQTPKELLRASGPTDRDSIIKMILELEPGLGEIFPDAGNKLSLLWIAVMFRYQCSAELLVRSGADVNERVGMRFNHGYVDEKMSILHCLLKMYPSSWNEKFVALVTDHGADLEARDSYGWTVLHCAARKSRVKAAKMLLERGADANAADDFGITPLLRAAGSRARDTAVADAMVLLLLEHGADASVRDASGKNVLHHLAIAPVERANQARVLIEKGASLDDRAFWNQRQPLHLAVREGKSQLVELFLELGANANALSENGLSPLHLAAECSAENHGDKMLVVLLKHGANIDLNTIRGRTALHLACHAFQTKNINVLWFCGADPCAEDLDGNTPLSLMLKKSHHLNESLKVMLQMLALKRESCAQQPPIELMKDERRIEDHPERWNYYQDCLKQVREAKSTRVLDDYTLFDLLTICPCQLAEPLRGSKKKLRKEDLEAFSEYYDIMLRVFRDGRYHCRYMMDQERVIHEAFYNTLPDAIVRKVTRYILECDDCKVINMVRASRSSADTTPRTTRTPCAGNKYLLDRGCANIILTQQVNVNEARIDTSKAVENDV